MSARVLVAAAIVALAAMIVAWHAVFASPQRIPIALATALHLLPLAPALVLLALRRRSAPFWGAVAALFLFCHGVAEAWSGTDAVTRRLAWAEVALSLVVVFGASWDGLRARFAKRRGV